MYLRNDNMDGLGFFGIGRKLKKVAKKVSYVLPGTALIVPNKDTAKGAAVSLAAGGTIATAVTAPKAGLALGKKLYGAYKDVKAQKKAVAAQKREAAAYEEQSKELEDEIRRMDEQAAQKPKLPIVPIGLIIGALSLLR